MRTMRVVKWFSLTGMLCVTSLYSQNTTRDVLYLKDGSVVRGLVIKFIPDSTIQIKTSTDSLFTYPFSDVKKMEKESIPEPQKPEFRSVHGTDPSRFIDVPMRHLFSIYCGLAIPKGDFGDPARGGGKTGMTIGAQLVNGAPVGFLLNASYSSNPSDYTHLFAPYVINGHSGNWKMIHIDAGPTFGTDHESGINFFAAPLLGFNICWTPALTYNVVQPGVPGLQSVTTESRADENFDFGFMVEGEYKRLSLGACYIGSKMSVLQIYIGVIL